MCQYLAQHFCKALIANGLPLEELDKFQRAVKKTKLNKDFFEPRVSDEGQHIKAFASEVLVAMVVLFLFCQLMLKDHFEVLSDHIAMASQDYIFLSSEIRRLSHSLRPDPVSTADSGTPDHVRLAAVEDALSTVATRISALEREWQDHGVSSSESDYDGHRSLLEARLGTVTSDLGTMRADFQTLSRQLVQVARERPTTAPASEEMLHSAVLSIFEDGVADHISGLVAEHLDSHWQDLGTLLDEFVEDHLEPLRSQGLVPDAQGVAAGSGVLVDLPSYDAESSGASESGQEPEGEDHPAVNRDEAGAEAPVVPPVRPPGAWASGEEGVSASSSLARPRFEPDLNRWRNPTTGRFASPPSTLTPEEETQVRLVNERRRGRSNRERGRGQGRGRGRASRGAAASGSVDNTRRDGRRGMQRGDESSGAPPSSVLDAMSQRDMRDMLRNPGGRAHHDFMRLMGDL